VPALLMRSTRVHPTTVVHPSYASSHSGTFLLVDSGVSRDAVSLLRRPISHCPTSSQKQLGLQSKRRATGMVSAAHGLGSAGPQGRTWRCRRHCLPFLCSFSACLLSFSSLCRCFFASPPRTAVQVKAGLQHPHSKQNMGSHYLAQPRLHRLVNPG